MDKAKGLLDLTNKPFAFLVGAIPELTRRYV